MFFFSLAKGFGVHSLTDISPPPFSNLQSFFPPTVVKWDIYGNTYSFRTFTYICIDFPWFLSTYNCCDLDSLFLGLRWLTAVRFNFNMAGGWSLICVTFCASHFLAFGCETGSGFDQEHGLWTGKTCKTHQKE